MINSDELPPARSAL